MAKRKVKAESDIDKEILKEIIETYEIQFEDCSSVEFYVTKDFAKCFSENHEITLCDCPHVTKIGTVEYVTYYYYCKEHLDSRMYVTVVR